MESLVRKIKNRFIIIINQMYGLVVCPPWVLRIVWAILLCLLVFIIIIIIGGAVTSSARINTAFVYTFSSKQIYPVSVRLCFLVGEVF